MGLGTGDVGVVSVETPRARQSGLAGKPDFEECARHSELAGKPDSEMGPWGLTANVEGPSPP